MVNCQFSLKLHASKGFRLGLRLSLILGKVNVLFPDYSNLDVKNLLEEIKKEQKQFTYQDLESVQERR